MAGKGGYQAPNSPAPVSGPGPLSQRTDGGPGQPIRSMPAAYYGERQEMNDIQAGAPMAQGQMPAGGPVPLPNASTPPAAPMTPPTPLTAPTERPDEPITAGVPIGPGPGPAPKPAEASLLLPYLPMLEARASSPDSSQTLKNIVSYLRTFV